MPRIVEKEIVMKFQRFFLALAEIMLVLILAACGNASPQAGNGDLTGTAAAQTADRSLCKEDTAKAVVENGAVTTVLQYAVHTETSEAFNYGLAYYRPQLDAYKDSTPFYFPYKGMNYIMSSSTFGTKRQLVTIWQCANL
jgi:hypothetical protein